LEIKTHEKISKRLCGVPVKVEKGKAEVELKTIPEMVADEKGLVHGGFVFGQADYAAMLAVNHPNVVLGSASVKFLKPVKVGDVLLAKAEVVKEEGKKRIVAVSVERNGEEVFAGEFVCFVLPKHVLER